MNALDSGGLDALAELRTSAQNTGGTIKLTSLTERVSDLLQITKLITVFDVYISEAEAIESFSAGRLSPAHESGLNVPTWLPSLPITPVLALFRAV